MARPEIDLRIELSTGQRVSGLLTEPPNAFARLALAHGADAGMRHRFMTDVSESLAQRGVSTLRYHFSYTETGSKRVDSPPVAHAAVRAAVDAAASPLPLFAGGKSFGARMTSQAQAISALPGVHGLVFFGFPLHPAGKPATERARHLADVRIPMLFLQGTRDALAEIELMEGTVGELGFLATLITFPDADHSFHVPARSGWKDAQILADMLDRTAAWMRRHTQP